jgi:hypothetical protein
MVEEEINLVFVLIGMFMTKLVKWLDDASLYA